jgi:GT2 family glycosyltransferase
MKFAYIIVSYNSYEDIKRLLLTIENQSRKPDIIIIVDNCSPNGDWKRLQELIVSWSIECIISEMNWGFAYACNIGILRAKQFGMTHFGLINPDATLPDPEYLAQIENAFEDTEYRIIGTFVVNKESQKVEFGWADIWRYTLYPTIRQRGILYDAIKKSEIVMDTDYATGSSLFFSVDLYDTVWKLDESYFMYFEETDYCMRVKQAWYKIGIINYTHIDHATSSSVGRMSWFYVRYMILNFARFAYHHARWNQIPGFLLLYLFFWIPGFLLLFLIFNIPDNIKSIYQS